MRCIKCGWENLPSETTLCPNMSCRANIAAILRDVLPAGHLLHQGKYNIQYALGKGGFGVTYCARLTATDGIVAIKEYFPDRIAPRDPSSGRLSVSLPDMPLYQRGLDIFRREATNLENITHPNVVRIRDFFEENNTAYLVMEYLNGQSLRAKMQNRPLTEEEICPIMESVVSALGAIHERHIYHLDIKPANIILEPGRGAVLIDFGASRQGTAFHEYSSIPQTTGYAPLELMRPERGREDAYGAETDIFELGVTLYELLTGRIPPPADVRAAQYAWSPDEVAEPWRTLITEATQVEREKRPQNVRVWWERATSSRGEEGVVVPVAKADSVELSSTPRLPQEKITVPPAEVVTVLPDAVLSATGTEGGIESQESASAVAPVMPLSSETILPPLPEVPAAPLSRSVIPVADATESVSSLPSPDTAHPAVAWHNLLESLQVYLRTYRGVHTLSPPAIAALGVCLLAVLGIVGLLFGGEKQSVAKSSTETATETVSSSSSDEGSVQASLGASTAVLSSPSPLPLDSGTGVTSPPPTESQRQKLSLHLRSLLQKLVTVKPLETERYSRILSQSAALVERGADVTTTNAAGGTLLHYACWNDNIALASRCVERGALIDAMDDDGITPLHTAAAAGAPHVLQFLLDSGANPRAVEFKTGKTALQWVEGIPESQRTLRHKEVFDLLQKREPPTESL